MIETGVFIYRQEFLDTTLITFPKTLVARKIYDEYGKFSFEYKSSPDYEIMLD